MPVLVKDIAEAETLVKCEMLYDDDDSIVNDDDYLDYIE